MLNTRFFRGPGLYARPMIMILDGKKDANPNPCMARKMNSISQFRENPAISEVMVSHTIPPK